MIPWAGTASVLMTMVFLLYPRVSVGLIRGLQVLAKAHTFGQY